MLQRAASNAYSWWWASHIRTKQSKWLEQNLQDMEEKVQNVLHLLQEDGDSFAKRAEMYYKKRPELINFVEETYRAYRALAERYEKISTDLQNANTTIASVFPEQVQFSMDDDDDDGTLSNFKPHGKDSEPSKPSIPKVPAPPKKNLKSLLTTATKNLQSNKASQRFKKVPAKSGLTEGQAVAEIDKLQKEILTLQTEKEFVKSAYENKLARYYDIDREISEMQERISSLQDEFNVGLIIEDDEARTLMASTALKSCQDTLTLLEEKQRQSSEAAETDQQNVKSETLSPEVVLSSGKDGECNGPLSITDMAEKIDELVQKVISLETQFSSQTAHVKRLKNEADELQKQVLSLEADKAALIDSANILSKKLQEMEDKSQQVLASGDIDMDKTLHETEENSLPVLPSDSGPEHSDIITSELQSFDILPNEIKSADTTTDGDDEGGILEASKHEESPHTQMHAGATSNAGGVTSGAVEDDALSQTKEPADEDEANWQELFMNGLDDKEKVILKEYTTTLRNYKELKKKLTDVEKKNNDTLLEFVSQIRELRSAVSKKDEEIQSLHQKLSFLKDHQDSEEQPIFDSSDGKISAAKETSEVPPGDQDNADDDRVLKEILSSKNLALSPIEEKFRSNIDGLLEENLNFWLRFSSAFHQIQKFQTEVEDLQAELGKIEEKKIKKQDSSSSSKHRNLKSDVLPIYKHLSEINAEISVWLEQSVLLKEELESRFSSLCNIQDEISAALVAACGAIEEAMFTSYQAAKFQGEILNMKQENNKVDDELQSAIDHATRVQLEIEKSLGKLDEDYKISESKNVHSNQPKLTHSESRNRVPLQSFIFGVKPKKQRYSIFSVMHPAMLKRHHDLKTGL